MLFENLLIVEATLNQNRAYKTSAPFDKDFKIKARDFVTMKRTV